MGRVRRSGRVVLGGAVVGILLGLAGCLDAAASRCADGSACRPGTICVDGLDLCADPGQLAACEGLAEGDTCNADGIPLGTCTIGVCVGAGCGNGVVDEGEVCDDHNSLSGDGCSADCKSTEICGNGIVDRDEQCDCGVTGSVSLECRGPNDDASGPCSTTCRLRCGDGVVSPDEGCDPGVSAVVSCAGPDFDRGLTTCTPSCQPLLSATTCRYIGFRTRVTQATDLPPVTRLAPTGADRGFFLRGNVISEYTAFTMAGSPFGAPQTLNGVWAASDQFAIAVGEQGLIIHWGGVGWETVTSGTSTQLRDVWGRDTDDVYAVGADTVLHWDGLAWTSLAPPPGAYRAVAGDATDVYVVGDQGAAVRWDGAQWHTLAVGTNENLESVWSTGGMVVAVGAAGTIVQDDGSGWTAGLTLTTADLHGVWGGPTEGFIAAGDRGTILFFDGHAWRPMSLGRGVTGSPSQAFWQVLGLPGVAMGLVGSEDLISYEGAAWSPSLLPTTETIYALWGPRTDDVFAVGRNGTILHHDGLAWTSQASPVSVDLRAVWGTSGDDVYAAGDDLTLLHYNGAAWSLLRQGPVGASNTGSFYAVMPLAPSTVIAAGSAGIFSYDAGTLAQTSTTAMRSLWATSASDVWAAGTGVQHLTGAGWVSGGLPSTVRGISGKSATDIYAVGSSSFHFNGTTWAVGPFDDPALGAVSASPQLGVFAAGNGGALQYWSGNALEPLIGRTTANQRAVWTIANLVFIAGDDGTLQVMVFHR